MSELTPLITDIRNYTVRQLHADFPDDAACLAHIVRQRYPNGITCSDCETITKHYRVRGRQAYACSRCGKHVRPTRDTIFFGSQVPLVLWFHAIYLMSTNKAGTSARQVQRELGVNYRTAWRMMHLIRSTMGGDNVALENEVEVDETYMHPNAFKRSSARRKYGGDVRRKGEILFGAVQRGGSVRIWHVKSCGVRVLQPIIWQNVKKGTLIHSDGHRSYHTLPRHGYPHRTTDHAAGQYYTEDSYTQNIENVWSHLKRGVKGVYRHVERAYLQFYANEFAWRYSHRQHKVLFWHLLGDTLGVPVVVR